MLKLIHVYTFVLEFTKIKVEKTRIDGNSSQQIILFCKFLQNGQRCVNVNRPLKGLGTISRRKSDAPVK